METEESKKAYEISFLIKDEAAVPELLTLLKEKGAFIIFEGPLKRIALAYKIKGEAHAHFGYFHFQMSPENAEEFGKALKSSRFLLRFLIVTPPLMKPVETPPSRFKREVSEEKKVLPGKAALPLSNEELEKKIDEILQ